MVDVRFDDNPDFPLRNERLKTVVDRLILEAKTSGSYHISTQKFEQLEGFPWTESQSIQMLWYIASQGVEVNAEDEMAASPD